MGMKYLKKYVNLWVFTHHVTVVKNFHKTPLLFFSFGDTCILYISLTPDGHYHGIEFLAVIFPLYDIKVGLTYMFDKVNADDCFMLITRKCIYF